MQTQVGPGTGVAAGAGATAANQATEIADLVLIILGLTNLNAATVGPSTTGASTSVANAVANTVILAANAARKGAAIFNDDTATTGATLNIALGFAASATAFTVRIPAQGYYEVPFWFRGAINGFASAATGNARITELT